MKKITYTIALLVSMFSAKAEYGMWLLTFAIEQTDGKKVTGYAYVVPTAFHKDSIENTSYLIRVLDQLDYKNDNTIRFSKNRVRYDYMPQGATEPSYIYKLVNEAVIKTSHIRTITIQEMLDSDFITVIRNHLTLQDTTWMKTKVVKMADAEGFLCGIQLYFHEYSSELEKLLKELKERAKKAAASEDDTAMEPVLKKIMQYKVIVIASCSC